jgi:TolB-like protein/Tfp pilus assembly protein PilF
MIGRTVSHYRIIEEIGEGALGFVYRAQDLRLKRTVALKFLDTHVFESDEQRSRFIENARSAAALDHPNICAVYEIDEDQGQVFVAMAFADGVSLEDKLKTGPLAVGDILRIAAGVARGLRAAHERSVVHRDLKSTSVIVSEEGYAKIADFGLAGTVEGANGVELPAGGTFAYMSPEQARGEAVDHRTDIWSFGVLLYEMLTGVLPFRKDYSAAIVYAILNDCPPPVLELCPNVPAQLARIVQRAMARDLDERYADMTEVLDELRSLDESLNPEADAPPVRARERHPSIGVLPFADMSREKDQEYFCDGIAEEVINALTRVEGVRVVARTSSFSFKGQTLDVRKIARKLGVETVLEGSVRKAGNQLRITAQLINAADGYHLWSERYDREMEDIFAIQDDITLAIVDKLKVTLLGGERDAIVKRHTVDLDAYNLYLKGRFFWNRRTEEGYRKGREFFEKAIKKDPTYALAYVGIADCYDLLGWYGHLSPVEAFPKARAAAQKAKEMDATLAEPHASLGWISANYDWDWDAAEKQYKKALEISPRYETAHQWYAEYLSYMGRHDEAVAHAKRACEIDPLSLIINSDLGQVLYYARQYDRAVERLKKVLEMDPAFAIARFLLGLTYAQKGMYGEAIDELRQASALSGGDDPLVVAHLGAACSFAGMKDDAKRSLAELHELSKKRYVAPFCMALIYVGMGRQGVAFQWLERAYNERDHWMETLKVHPMLDDLRSSPRYGGLVYRMGLG